MNRKVKMLIAAACALALIAASASAGAAFQRARFGDVPTDHYAYDAVEWAAETGITTGCGDGTNFCPTKNLNRAHMVTFLKRYHDKFGRTTAPTQTGPAPSVVPYADAKQASAAWLQDMRDKLEFQTEAKRQEVAQDTVEKIRAWDNKYSILSPFIKHHLGILEELIKSGDTRIASAFSSSEQNLYIAAAAHLFSFTLKEVAIRDDTSVNLAGTAAGWTEAAKELGTKYRGYEQQQRAVQGAFGLPNDHYLRNYGSYDDWALAYANEAKQAYNQKAIAETS